MGCAPAPNLKQAYLRVMLNHKRLRNYAVVSRLAKIYKLKDKKKYLRAQRIHLDEPAVFVPIDPP